MRKRDAFCCHLKVIFVHVDSFVPLFTFSRHDQVEEGKQTETGATADAVDRPHAYLQNAICLQILVQGHTSRALSDAVIFSPLCSTK